jgi:hypothetical protein
MRRPENSRPDTAGQARRNKCHVPVPAPITRVDRHNHFRPKTSSWRCKSHISRPPEKSRTRAAGQHRATSLTIRVPFCDLVAAPSTYHTTAKAHHQSCRSGALHSPATPMTRQCNLHDENQYSRRTKNRAHQLTSDVNQSFWPLKA